MDRRPIIGATPYKRNVEPFDLYLPPGVIRAVEELGGETRLFDYEKLTVGELAAAVDAVDGFIFSGGVDVHPARYGEAVAPDCGKIDEKRDEIELALFEELEKRGLPMLGICRGCQVINVALGGTLYQHIPNHRQNDEEGRFWHVLSLEPGTFLRKTLGKSRLMTNSYHHQSVKALAPGLTRNAVADDGTVEGFERMEGGFLLAVQWHPESTLDDDSDSIKPFVAFMEAARERMAALSRAKEETQ